MRPGPGLVVMALAFISGARRASTTNTISSSSGSSSSSSSSGGSSSSSGSGGSSWITSTTATTTPAITTTQAAAAAAAAAAATYLPSSYDSGRRGRESSTFGGAGGGYTFLLPTLGDGSPGEAPANVNPLNLDFIRRPALHAPDEPLPASSTRRARSVDAGRTGTETAAAGAPESSEATLIGENEETETEAETETEREEQQEEEEDNSGLPVQYASSRAFDVDADADVTDRESVADEDIFALVAEDDLLSEESFDRLIKLSEDADNAAAEEEDYNLAASLALTQQRQRTQREQRQRERETERETEQQDESRLVDESVLHTQHNEHEKENSHSHSNSNSNNNNSKRETGEQQVEQQSEREGNRANDAYASHLIAIAQRDGGTLPAAVAATTTTTAAGAAAAGSLAAPVNLKKSILGTATALTRLNPWISACDLAQPGTTGTDLQGQCSAGTLPMAWVDEGPGPPICPRSCAEQQPMDSSASSVQARTDNKLKYFINTNTINFKSPHTRLSQTNNNNNNNNYKAMSRVRRDRQWDLSDAVESTMATLATATASTEQDDDEELAELEEEQPEATTSLAATASSNDADELEDQSMPTLVYSHQQTQEQLSANEQQQQQQHQQQQQPQQQQQQCLDYLGDAAETSPQHLCGLRSPGQLLGRLRTLRLRHCCERSVFSALHTLALNATLADRGECVRLLSDLLDVDALASRITCELAEILFRFDCRQVYSLINQCDDCKEVYRRWVCSTLVPYFAEPQDVDAAPTTKSTPQSQSQSQPQPTPAPASASVDDLATRGAAGKSKRAARIAGGGEAAAAVAAAAAAAAAGGTGGIKHKSQKLISNNNKSNNGNNMNERQINQQHDEDNEPQSKIPNANSVANVAQAFYNVVGIGQRQRQSPAQIQTQSQSQSQSQLQAHNSKSRDATEKQFNNFISTANNADPSAADPVISKLQKRSTRKAEFRKRRRIRPCLSVCQTVEQKCPYLLPADRAPALPTQYAGEPTFSCLDQNIPETGEQLKKSSYGPNDCCYSYCNGPTEGVCTICAEFAASRPPKNNNNNNNSSDSSDSSSGRRVHNITLTLNSPPGEHARAASVSLALRNVSTARSAGAELLERLPYFAQHDGVYYYDDDEGSDMPELALSGGCAAVPSVTSRCEIPYYASGVAPSPPTQLLVWLSALLGLLSSCGAARQRCGRARGTGRVDCPASCHELLASASASPGPEAQHGASRSGNGNGNGSASFTASHSHRHEWSWSWLWAWPLNTCRKMRYFRSSSRSKLKLKCVRGRSRDRSRIIINYRDLQQLQIQIRIRIKCSDRNRNARNYRYFYYYNYNINDWWRRWKWLTLNVATIISNGAL